MPASRNRVANLGDSDSYVETLHSITLGLLTHRDLDELLEGIVRAAGKIINTANGYIDLVDEEANEIRPIITRGTFSSVPRTPLKPGEGLSGNVWQSGEPMVVNDYDTWEGRLASISPGILQSVVCIPLKSETQVIGVLGLAYDRQSRQAFGQEKIELLSQFAALATLSIINVRLYITATQAAKRRTILYRATQDIGASLNMEQVCAAVHHAVELVMPCEDFVIAFYDEDRNEIAGAYIVERGQKVTPPPYLADHGLGGYVVHMRRSVRLGSQEQIAASGIKFEPYGSGPITSSVLAVPLRRKGKIVGMISAQSYQAQAYTADDQELLEMLAAHAAVAFDNVQLFARIQQLAATDELTGLFNRRHFLELAEREFERSRRYERLLSALMIDIDHFKKANDTYGHPAGDRILRVIAKRCKEELRKIDILGRYGGEEFVILLPETNTEQAKKIAGRLCHRIAQTEVDIDQGIVLNITMSLGVASLEQDCASLVDLLGRADQALYAAKKAGRNRVRVWRG